MTDPIASASIFIRPDTTKFRALLDAEIKAATAKPIAIPVIATPVGGGITSSIGKATASTTALAAATKNQAKAAVESTAATAAQAREMSQLERGAAAATLSMAGVRGATLAASSRFLAGAAAIAIFAKAIGQTVKFQQQIAVFGATTSATADQMRRVADAAKEMGQDLTLPGISAADAATAMTELAKAGLSVEDSIAGARGVLQLAIAANISFADATTLAASALNAFGLAGTEAVHVADILANAANAAQGSISDMGLALQQSAAVGRQVGLSLQDTTTFLTILAREGLRGSDAGTSLRVTLGRLINPTKKITAALEGLGLSLRDANGNIRPDFFSDLGVAISKMSKSQKDATLAIIGGMDGMRALSILTRHSIGSVIDFRKQLDQQGTAAELASARMTGLAGAGSNLANTLQGVGLSIGNKVTPALTSLTNAATSTVSTLANVFGKLNESLNIGAVLAAVAAYKLLPPILATVTGALEGVTGATIASSIALARSAGIAVTVRAAMGSLLAAINPMTLALAAVGAGLFLFFTRSSGAETAARALTQTMGDLSRAQSDVARTAREAADAEDQVKTNILGVQSARLAVAQARANIATSGAAPGSTDQKVLQNQLAIAIDNVRIAEGTLADTRKRAADAALLAAAAERTRNVALADSATTLDQLNIAEQGGLISHKEFAAALEKEAAAQEALGTVESVQLAKRIRALKALADATNKIPTRHQIEVFLEDKNFRRALQNLVVAIGEGGDDGGKAFTHNLLTGTQDALTGVLNQMNASFPSWIGAFGVAGTNAAVAFGNNLIALVQQTLAIVRNLIASAATETAGVVTTLAQQEGLAEAAGNTQGALAISRRQERAAKNAQARAKEAGDQKAFSKATDKLIAAQNQSNSLEQQLLANQTKASKTAASAAKSASDAQDKADQAVVKLFEAKQAKLDIKLAIAQNTKGLLDDIRAQLEERKALRRQILVYKNSIKDEATRKELIDGLRLKIIQTTGTIKQLNEERKKNQAALKAGREARKKKQRDEFLAGLELNVQIAEARENTKGEITARERLIAGLVKARATVRKGTNAYRKLTLEIEQEKKALRDLLKQTKDSGNVAKSLQFEFLQQQQGFAATLLGNLIPGSAALGTVGGGGGLGTGGMGFGPGLTGGLPAALAKNFATGPSAFEHGRGQGSGTGRSDLQVAGGPKGTTHAQTSTMIQILRMILHALNHQNRRHAAPEANHQRHEAGARTEMM